MHSLEKLAFSNIMCTHLPKKPILFEKMQLLIFIALFDIIGTCTHLPKKLTNTYVTLINIKRTHFLSKNPALCDIIHFY